MENTHRFGSMHYSCLRLWFVLKANLSFAVVICLEGEVHCWPVFTPIPFKVKKKSGI